MHTTNTHAASVTQAVVAACCSELQGAHSVTFAIVLFKHLHLPVFHYYWNVHYYPTPSETLAIHLSQNNFHTTSPSANPHIF